MISALFVAENGPYFGIAGVDPWAKDRDARNYAGPNPVVAHPPCERWGRYWSGGPSSRVRKVLGNDGGCFASALMAVRNFGGVIEHPAHSLAWRHFGLIVPDARGGWSGPDRFGAFVCHVEQGNYGHRARKATWLYAVSKYLPDMKWGPSSGVRIDEGFHSREERARARCRDQASRAALEERTHPHADPVSRSVASNRRAKEAGLTACEFLSKRQRSITPVPFRDLLLEIARRSR